MRFLREESGQLLILSQPSAGVAGSPMRVPAKEARVTPVPQVRRAATQHCRFFCRWCGSLVLLAHDRIGLPFGAPNLRKIESRTVAAVCGSCNHVNNFSLFRGGLGFDTRHGLVQADTRVEPVLIDWLQCQEANCEFPLPLFLLPPEPLSVEVVRDLAMTWHWNELACPAGHRVLAPLWIFGRAPYRFPDPIR
jgi:hypothetical protein